MALVNRRKKTTPWITDDILEYYKTHSARETCEHFDIEYTPTRQRALSHAYPKQEDVEITEKMVEMYLDGATWRQVAKRFRRKQRENFRKALIKASGAQKGKGRFNRNLPEITPEMVEYYQDHTFLDTCKHFKLKATKALQNRFAKIGKQQDA